MAGPKTSAEKARDEAENAAADDMFGGAFDGIDGLTPPEEEKSSNTGETIEEPTESEEETSEEEKESEKTEATDVDYNSMTVPTLKAALKEQGLPVSGKKADLIERLKGDSK